ncbi:MAG TPA: ferredoxin--NADP reductase [Noviherbaspirillum sp.]|uniref:ferredoxin--NADP reductase n=1 Tax=Noviherbaspirillum sp. TaxID=1926288 RepID=UPI002B4777FA|nr:ferredoxin--NADP reductase [Noviherbaspirillum sp.]HJV85384.1 ferredoxin--NADP reductase [Noviherbaspirillum sp.]
MLIDPKIADKATVETITRLDWWNDRLLTFTTTRPANYSFAAGQYARIGLKDEHGLLWRAYSMVSSPREDHLEFYGIVVPGGLFTTELRKAAAGSEILIEKQSYGFMTPDRFSDGDDLWMLATGTGLGPFLSMLRDTYVWQHFRNIVLVHCVRQESEFAYREELEHLRQHPPAIGPARLHIVRSTTREQQTEGAPPHLHGRITTLLENGELEKCAGLPLTVEASRIMMCGNPDMIEDMRKLLHHRGMRPVRRTLPGQFVTENYW